MKRPGPPAAVEEDTVDLAALLRTIWAGKRWILTSMFACGLLGGVYAWILATPIYRATAVVMLESREASIAGLDSVLGELSTATNSVVRTEIEVLRGRALMGRVVDALELTADPEFNESLVPPGPVQRVKALVSGLIVRPAPDPRSPEERRVAEHASTVSALLEQVKIVNISGSLAFQIEASSISGNKAASIADTLARLYIEDQRRVRYEATEAASSWLADQLAELRASLEQAETEVRSFQGETNLIDAETLAAMDRQLKESRNRRSQILTQVTDLESRLQQMEATTDPVERAQITRDDQLMVLAAILPGDVTDRNRFDQQLALVSARMTQDLVRLRGQSVSLSTAANVLAADIERQSRDLIRLDQLTREAESSRLLYEHFQTRLKETSAQLGIQQADSRILSDAAIPGGPAAPRKNLVLAVSLLLGAILGTFFVLLREMQSTSLRSGRDLETLTGLPVLAQIPEIPGKTRNASLAWLMRNPTSAPAEAVRNLRTSILLASGKNAKAPQVIVVTSSLPGEGKTTLTAALAQSLTAMGRKILVIEGDIRKQTISRQFIDGASAHKGLMAVLHAEIPLSAAIQQVSGRSDILPCEVAHEGAVDLFASEAFVRLIAEARASYDMVLIDTPPLLAVPDARIIAQEADATVFVVHWDQTTQEQVVESLQQLETVNVPVAGLVLSHINADGMRRYGYHGGGYDYRKAYGAA